ncbi:unnamed protein product [Protopolystoma xenopodis]|uniref:Uncharacterized protein n=1 Tax=Protopolystoma xenopodis TaxID=117903 RepID=A0A3S5AQW3_9PLAT|nr:unnamed protein product [Protopolystoma xenopodis]
MSSLSFYLDVLLPRTGDQSALLPHYFQCLRVVQSANFLSNSLSASDGLLHAPYLSLSLLHTVQLLIYHSLHVLSHPPNYTLLPNPA